jgi:putative transposase
VIREDAAMPISRFCALTGIPRRSYTRWRAKAAAGNPPKGPWPAPVVDVLEPVAAKYAADWPAWGHRKIAWLMAADGHTASASSIERALRRRGLLQPVDYQGQRRELAQARRAAFAQPPTGPNQVWQLDFSEYETTSGGIWRLAGVTDYFSKYEHGWHLAPTCTGADAIAALHLAITEAERLLGGPLFEALTDPDTGELHRLKIVTDNGGAFVLPKPADSAPKLPAGADLKVNGLTRFYTDIQYGCGPCGSGFVRPALSGSGVTGARSLPLLHRSERVLLAC